MRWGVQRGERRRDKRTMKLPVTHKKTEIRTKDHIFDLCRFIFPRDICHQPTVGRSYQLHHINYLCRHFGSGTEGVPEPQVWVRRGLGPALPPVTNPVISTILTGSDSAASHLVRTRSGADAFSPGQATAGLTRHSGLPLIRQAMFTLPIPTITRYRSSHPTARLLRSGNQLVQASGNSSRYHMTLPLTHPAPSTLWTPIITAYRHSKRPMKPRILPKALFLPHHFRAQLSLLFWE